MAGYGANLFGGNNGAILWFIILFLLLFANGGTYIDDIVD